MQLATGIHRWLAASAALSMLAATPAPAQWIDVPAPEVPRTADGEIDLDAPAPRLPSGRVDLQGVWGIDERPSHLHNLALDMDPDDVPFQLWARELFEERVTGAHFGRDPDSNCLPQGVPRVAFVPGPWKIVETPNSIVIVYEAFTLWRQIFTDGREMGPNAYPNWLGYSTGAWEGDTFVVETRGFNGKIWLDTEGRPSTTELHVTERFTRTAFGRMTIDVTIDDPGAYTDLWHASVPFALQVGWEPLEYICGENNKIDEY